MAQVTVLAMWVAAGAVVVQRASAGPLDRSRVDHDAAWLIHVDMERLRESPVGSGVLSGQSGFPGSMFRDLRTDLGLDPGTDINGITVYGLPKDSAEQSADSVVLIAATSAADKLPEFMQEAHPDSFEETKDPGPAFLSWTVDDVRWFLSVHAGGGRADRLVVMSKSRERVASALAVLDKTRPDLSWAGDPGIPNARNWPFDQDPAKGSIVFLVANRAMWGGKDATSPAFKGTRGMVLELREQHDDAGDRWTQLSTRMRMESEQHAEQMVKVAEGALSWLRLSAEEAESPEACCKALDAAAPKRDGTEVSLDLKVNSRELATILDTVRTVHSPNKVPAAEKPTDKAENPDTKPGERAKNPVSSTLSPR